MKKPLSETSSLKNGRLAVSLRMICLSEVLTTVRAQ